MRWRSNRSIRDYWLSFKAQGGVFEEPSWAYQSQQWMLCCLNSVPLGQTVLNWHPFVLASHNTSVSSGEVAPTPANYIQAPPENPGRGE